MPLRQHQIVPMQRWQPALPKDVGTSPDNHCNKMKLGVVIFFVSLILVSCLDLNNFQFNLGNLAYLVDFPSLVIVLVPTIFFAIGAYSWETYAKTWSVPFGDPENCDQPELVEVSKCLNTMGNMTVVMGIVGAFIGVILTLNYIQLG